jgi:DNA-binding CsgD family transcriptional regulator
MGWGVLLRTGLYRVSLTKVRVFAGLRYLTMIASVLCLWAKVVEPYGELLPTQNVPRNRQYPVTRRPVRSLVMRVLFTQAPALVRQERPSLKVALASAWNGNGLVRHVPTTSAKIAAIAAIPRQFERANSDSPGLLLLDPLRQPLYANDEAISILSYPESPRKSGHVAYFLVRKIDSLIPRQNCTASSKVNSEFSSGKRRYQVRVFTLKSPLENGLGPTLAVLLERNGGHVDVTQAAQEFHLTQRETEALELLMQGHTTKQIAGRMSISPNTAKAFLRAVMFKTGASNRSGILAKILQLSKTATG